MTMLERAQMGFEKIAPEGSSLRRHWPMAAAGGGALAVLLTGTIAFANLGAKPKEEEKVEPVAQVVTALAVEEREFAGRANVSGEVRPVQDVQVFAPAGGLRISEVLVDAGDYVAAGQPLARLDAGVAEAQLRAAEALMQEAKVEETRAAGDYARALAIADSGALSLEAIATRKAAADAAAARMGAQMAALSEVKARLQGGFVRAPVAGMVLERSARVGEFADQRALFRIAGGNRLEVAAEVSEADVLALRKGQQAEFRLSDGSRVTGTLRRPPVAIDSQRRTGEALFDLPRDARIRSGMYLRGEVVVDQRLALAAPLAAVSYSTGKPSVFVLSADDHARQVEVLLGPRDGDWVAIVDGLDPGQRIAAAGGGLLQDGDLIRSVEADGSVPASGTKPAKRG